MNILVLGDSIARGAYDRKQGGWVERLKLRGFTQEDVFVYNQGISAYSTRALKNNIESFCKMEEFKIIIVAIGINDSRYNSELDKNNVSIDEFKENLEYIQTIVSQYSSQIIFVGLTYVDESKTIPISWKRNLSYTNSNTKLYDQTLKEACAEKNNVGYIHLYDLLDNADLDDGLHPNASGHQKIFEKVLQHLQNNKII